MKEEGGKEGIRGTQKRRGKTQSVCVWKGECRPAEG